MPPYLLARQDALLGKFVKRRLGDFQILGEVVDGKDSTWNGGWHTNSFRCGTVAPMIGIASLSVASGCCQLPDDKGSCVFLSLSACHRRAPAISTRGRNGTCLWT